MSEAFELTITETKEALKKAQRGDEAVAVIKKNVNNLMRNLTKSPEQIGPTQPLMGSMVTPVTTMANELRRLAETIIDAAEAGDDVVRVETTLSLEDVTAVVNGIAEYTENTIKTFRL